MGLPDRAQDGAPIVGEGRFETQRNAGALQIVDAREGRQADPARAEPLGFQQGALERLASVAALGMKRALDWTDRDTADGAPPALTPGSRARCEQRAARRGGRN